MTTAPISPQESTISIPRRNQNGEEIQAFFVLPAGPGPFPGMVVIHEIFGLNDNIRDIARRFAGSGYAALAVDLFSGPSRIICMLRLMSGMLFRPLKNQGVADLQASLEALKSQPQVDAGRLGVVGFCMGGSYALQLACVGQDLKAASVFYGQNPKPLEAVAQACPIIGNYPEKDFTAQAARQLEPVLEKYSIPHDIKIYTGARHSFFNDQGPAYDPEAAEDSWKRMLAFFDKYILASSQ